ncbi:hypothetical protein CSKR_203321 [Clonorchis sinensis]|uniref:Secreted protein n=1 Tax=Clonorchis sinensis TaxID=79923 RepID=A0A8T1MAV5_CLOSI|nr:hypothetical protein CSKR_203321 [Clonorchis sinensis]
MNLSLSVSPALLPLLSFAVVYKTTDDFKYYHWPLRLLFQLHNHSHRDSSLLFEYVVSIRVTGANILFSHVLFQRHHPAFCHWYYYLFFGIYLDSPLNCNELFPFCFNSGSDIHVPSWIHHVFIVPGQHRVWSLYPPLFFVMHCCLL